MLVEEMLTIVYTHSHHLLSILPPYSLFFFLCFSPSNNSVHLERMMRTTPISFHNEMCVREVESSQT